MNIIITGAGKGIGFETAKTLLADGKHNVLAISRNTTKLKRITSKNLHFLSADLESADTANQIATHAEELFESIDILIHNAGYLVKKPFAEQNNEDFDRQFAVNVKAVASLTQALIPLMHPGSHVVTIGSMAGYQGSKKFPGLSLYSASKAALAALTECLAAEYSGAGIAFNCLSLGSVQTEMFGKAFPGYNAPLSPQQMGNFIADFALKGNTFYNGKILPVALGNP
jgi:NAD(P)-dependent dehydrogenase (short-subunit alcohol dehydrogenase family)